MDEWLAMASNMNRDRIPSDSDTDRMASASDSARMVRWLVTQIE